MGSQQLLILFFVTLTAAIALVVGIFLFESSDKQANRDAIMSELSQLIFSARAYYKKSTMLGGGGGNYRTFKMPDAFRNSTTCTIERIKKNHAKSHIHFLATGNAKGVDGVNSISIEVAAYASGIKFFQLN